MKNNNAALRETDPTNNIEGRDRITGLWDTKYIHYLYFSSNLG